MHKVRKALKLIIFRTKKKKEIQLNSSLICFLELVNNHE